MTESERFDILVIGAGPAGIAAATVAAESGRRVGLVEATPWLGGQIWRGTEAKTHSPPAKEWVDRLGASGAEVLRTATVVAAPEEHRLLLERACGSMIVGWERLIIATGARELFLPFPGWTLPGVLGPGGLQLLVKSGWPVHGKRVIIAGSGPLLLAAADGLRSAGAEVLLIVEQATPRQVANFVLRLTCLAPGKLFEAMQYRRGLWGVPYRLDSWVVAAEGHEQVTSVTIREGDRCSEIACDLLACAFGLIPNTEMAALLGCDIKEGAVTVDQWQQTSRSEILCAGESTGIGGVDQALIEGQIAGWTASGCEDKAARLFRARRWSHRFGKAMEAGFALRPELRELANGETIVCRCEDVIRSQLAGYDNWRAAKLQTRCGMGPCQGRVCGAATRVLFGWGPESVRPPIFPARVATLAGYEPPQTSSR